MEKQDITPVKSNARKSLEKTKQIIARDIKVDTDLKTIPKKLIEKELPKNQQVWSKINNWLQKSPQCPQRTSYESDLKK
jgi:hypothetical protein